MTGLDAIDRRLIAELTKDARLPVQTLANRIGLSRNAVRLRLRRLEITGAIAGYTLKSARSGAGGLTSILLIRRKDRMRGGDVIRYLKQIPEVRGCWIVSGELDIVAVFQAADQDRLREIWHSVSRLDGAADIVTAFALDSPVELT